MQPPTYFTLDELYEQRTNCVRFGMDPSDIDHDIGQQAGTVNRPFDQDID